MRSFQSCEYMRGAGYNPVLVVHACGLHNWLNKSLISLCLKSRWVRGTRQGQGAKGQGARGKGEGQGAGKCTQTTIHRAYSNG